MAAVATALNELLELEYVSKRYGDMLATFNVLAAEKKVLTDRQVALVEYAFFTVIHSTFESWTAAQGCHFGSFHVRQQYLTVLEKDILQTCQDMLNNLYVHLFPNSRHLTEVKRYHYIASYCYRFMSDVSRLERKKTYVKQSVVALSFYHSIDVYENNHRL